MENIRQLTFWMSRLRWRDSQKHQQRVKVQLEAGGLCRDEYNPDGVYFIALCDGVCMVLPFVFCL